MKLILKDKIRIAEWKITDTDKLDDIMRDIKLKYKGRR